MLDPNSILDTIGLAKIKIKQEPKINTKMGPNSQHFSSRNLKHKLEQSLS